MRVENIVCGRALEWCSGSTLMPAPAFLSVAAGCTMKPGVPDHPATATVARRCIVPVRQLKEFLDNNNVKYVSITHSTAYTAQEIAALTHTKGRDLAKTVIVELDGAMAMAVLPASFQIDLDQLKQRAGANNIRLPGETIFRNRFPGCETGAMPPFGNLFDMPVFVDESLTREKEIAFSAGSHNEVIRMSYEDFARLVIPKVLRFSAGKAITHAA